MAPRRRGGARHRIARHDRGWLGNRRAEALADRAPGARRSIAEIGVYIVAPIAGGIGGAALANAMFAVPTRVSTTNRATTGHFLAEVVATAGLVLVIFALVRSRRASVVAPAVAAYIGAAYWFTSSTSFANPAVTIGRIFTDTFAGIAPTSTLPFVGAQIIGAAIGVALDPHREPANSGRIVASHVIPGGADCFLAA